MSVGTIMLRGLKEIPKAIVAGLGGMDMVVTFSKRAALDGSLKIVNLVLILISLFCIGVQAQVDKNKPYWEYVRTESGVYEYDKNGCYQPKVHKAVEGFVDITVTKCFHPDDKTQVRTRLKFEWAKLPHIIYPGVPFDYKLTATLVENTDPNWVISGSVWITSEITGDGAYSGPFPGWAGGRSAQITKGSPNIVTLDNLKLPANQQQSVPGGYFGKPSILRITIVCSHSNQHWWSYIYRYIDPSQTNKVNSSGQIDKVWKTVERDVAKGQYWEVGWRLKDDGRSFDGHWKHFPSGREGDLPGFASIRFICDKRIVIDRPGLGVYEGTISTDRKRITGTISWCSTCTWEVELKDPLPMCF